MTNLSIQYLVNGNKYSLNLEICERTTPRSIYVSCLNDYKKRNIEKVLMPYWDDDNDIFSDSNIDLKIVFIPEFYELESLKNLELSKKECREMFN
jgi:hypothetical protein